MKKIRFKLAVLLPVALLCTLAVLPLLALAVGQPFWMSWVTRILIYATAASALNLALGYGGLVSLGHALFLGLGAYAVALPAHFSITNGFAHLAICIVVSALIALVTGMISLRATGTAFIMITLAFAQMGYFLFVGLKNFGGDDGLPVSQTSRFFQLDLGSPKVVYFASLLVLACTIILLAKFRTSPFGMALRGARDNARRVSAIGFEPYKCRLVAYTVSGTICGIAGLLLANLTAYASPSTLAWTVSGDLVAMVVLGGMGTIFGPFIGAVLFFSFEEVLKSVSDHWLALYGLLILLIALVGKRGVLGLLEQFDSRSDRNRVSSAVESNGLAS